MLHALLWIGIILIILGWLALAWQASKRMSYGKDLEKFPEKRKALQLKRNYCFLTMLIGILLLLIALIIN